GVQVVIQLLDTRCAQANGIRLGQKPNRAADPDVDLLLDPANRIDQVIDLVTGRAAPTDDDAKAAASSLARSFGPGDQSLEADQRVLVDIGRGDAGLRAVVTVLRTEAALRV